MKELHFSRCTVRDRCAVCGAQEDEGYVIGEIHHPFAYLQHDDEKHWQFCFEQFIKDTVADEFADICIRLYDFLGVLGGKLQQKPSTDSFVLWLDVYGNFTFAECAYELCTMLAEKRNNVESAIAAALSFTRWWAKHLGVDLQQHIELKMQYNAKRAPLHGKQY